MFRDQCGESACGYCGLTAEQTRYVVLRRSMFYVGRCANSRPISGRPVLQIVEFAANLEEATTGEEIFSFNLIKRK